MYKIPTGGGGGLTRPNKYCIDPGNLFSILYSMLKLSLSRLQGGVVIPGPGMAVFSIYM